MYCNPHAICAVAEEMGGLAGPAGYALVGPCPSACAIPYAPLGLAAWLFQPDSCVHILSKDSQLEVPGPQPYSVAIGAAIAWFFLAIAVAEIEPPPILALIPVSPEPPNTLDHYFCESVMGVISVPGADLGDLPEIRSLSATVTFFPAKPDQASNAPTASTPTAAPLEVA